MPFCENHPNVEATVHCADCGAWLCRNCAARFGGRTICGLCKDIAADAQADAAGFAGAPGAPLDESERVPAPWERQQELGFWRAIGGTIQGALFRPVEFFRTLRTDGPHGKVLLYVLLLGTVGYATSYLLQYLVLSQQLKLLLQFFQNLSSGSGGGPSPQEVQRIQQFFQLAAQWMRIGLILALLASPFLAVFHVYVTAGLCHLGLLIVGGANRGFEATFRTIAYCYGSAAIFYVIPGVGGLAGFWALIVSIFGLREMHGTTTGKAAFAVLWPLVLGCICAVVGIAIAAAMIGAAVSAKGGGGL